MPPDLLWLLYVSTLLLTVLTQAVVGYWVYARQWDRAGATWFLVMVATGMVWVAPSVLTLFPIDPVIRQALYLFAFVGSALTISAFVVFVSTYTGTGIHRRRPVQAILVAAIGGAVVLAPTNGAHHLIVRSFTASSTPIPHLVIERGPAFWAIMSGLQLAAYYSVYVMARHLLSTRRHAWKQLLMFIVGALSLGVLDVVSRYTTVFPVQGFTYATLGMFVFYLLTAISLFRFRLLDVKPVARNTVVETLRDPVVVLDDQQRVVDFNDAASGVWPDIADRTGELFPQVCPDLAEKLTLPPTADSGGQVTLSRDGEERHFSVTVSAVAERSGGDSGWCSILLRDVTELERSRWQLEKQNERLDQVASTISHDLRNPINVAAGHLGILQEDLADLDLPADERDPLLEHVESSNESVERMETIIDDVLTIAREGKTTEETERLRLRDAAEAAWDHVDTREGKLSVTEDRHLQADRSKLLTILENLFRNALDHGPEDVTVTVSGTDDGFAVADDGPGIPPEDKADVFEYGYTSAADGTGLGLSIVKTMAESHGWTVELDEEYPDGARFVFTNVDRSDDFPEDEAVAYPG